MAGIAHAVKQQLDNSSPNETWITTSQRSNAFYIQSPGPKTLLRPIMVCLARASSMPPLTGADSLRNPVLIGSLAWIGPCSLHGNVVSAIMDAGNVDREMVSCAAAEWFCARRCFSFGISMMPSWLTKRRLAGLLPTPDSSTARS